MKILYLGQLGNGQTCRMRMEDLQGLGNDIVPLNTRSDWESASWFAKHLQGVIGGGPVVRQLNARVLRLAEEHRPDLMWGDKQEYLYPRTLRILRHLGVKTVHFTPDPYFSLKWKRTCLMDECMPLWDVVITSKTYELDEYKRTCKKVLYMPLGFSEQVHRPTFPTEANARAAFTSDVTFVGGWEPRREEFLTSVASINNCDLKIWGYAWDHLIDGRWSVRRSYRLRINAGRDRYRIARNDRLAHALKGGEIYGENYACALSAAKIGIGFLRKVCPDQHTTRSFEIPACRSMMIADRTDEHRDFFIEGKEAEFFSSKEELIEKIRYYLTHESERQSLADAGYKRCLQSGYSYRQRLSNVLAEIAP